MPRHRPTDRYVGPNKTMFPGEAPLRRMVCIRRRVGGIYVDEEWEPWERLTYKGLRRKSTAARVSLTVFAQAKIPDAMPDASSADAPISAGRVHGIDMPDDQASKRHRADVPEVQQQSHHNITDNHNLHNHNSNIFRLQHMTWQFQTFLNQWSCKLRPVRNPPHRTVNPVPSRPQGRIGPW